MNSLQQPVKYTYRDLLAFPDDGKRREIIDGELFVSPAPALPHQVVVGNLHFAIRLYLTTHPIGRVFLAPLDVVFSKFDVVEPDLLFVLNARQSVLTRKNVTGSPDLAIEVVSAASRHVDERRKLRLYERFEVLEYWIVYPTRETIVSYRRAKAGVGFERVCEVSAREDTVLTSPLLPGLALDLRAVFADMPTH